MAESRIPLFEQSTETRSEELKAQGVRPRVWFGERWITSIFDLFEENARYYPGAAADLQRRGSGRGPGRRRCAQPGRAEAAQRDGVPLEPPGLRRQRRRPAPAGRESGAARRADRRGHHGQRRVLRRVWSASWPTRTGPIWSQMSFQAATENFAAGIRYGINAEVYWPRIGQVKVTELVVRKLLPMAAEGLRSWDVDEAESARLLGIIEHRCLRAANGATWQTAEVARREAAGDSRDEALRGMLSAYLDRMHSNEPVHLWPSRSDRGGASDDRNRHRGEES